MKIALHTQILIGLVFGLVCGLVVNITAIDFGTTGEVIGKLNEFIGDVFIRALRFVAIPVVVFSLIFGAGGLGGPGKLGQIGLKTFVLYLTTTAIAIFPSDWYWQILFSPDQDRLFLKNCGIRWLLLGQHAPTKNTEKQWHRMSGRPFSILSPKSF